MNYVWFWTFWHWSKESFRQGGLLRSPLQGVGSHWDEWYQHEASVEDRQAIDEIGRSESAQRQFLGWLLNHWAQETEWRGQRPVLRFVVGQLSQVSPFIQWAVLAPYRKGYGAAAIAAIVLAEESAGEAADVRQVEAVVLPADADPLAPKIVAEGFSSDGSELGNSRLAAQSLLGGRGLMGFLFLWIVAGRRPYANWLKIMVGAGWLVAGGTIVLLMIGPDQGQALAPICASLLVVWICLVAQHLWVVAKEVYLAFRQGRVLSGLVDQSQVRLRMNGGLTLRGASAGLPFCLNTLLATLRAHPEAVKESWLWERCSQRLKLCAGYWAATGVITPEGWLKPVVLSPKLRACLQQARINHLLTPGQRDASQRVIDRLAGSMATVLPKVRGREQSAAANIRLGFATEPRLVSIHRCRHVAQSLMTVGGLTSLPQFSLNVFAVIVSVVMVLALPDLRAVLLPPPAPAVVGPGSPSPYHLWVSLDTKQPDYFRVVLESDFWANRIGEVHSYSGANASVRAEIVISRLADRISRDEDNGVVWVERRRRFLTREFAPGERVGRYPLSYLTRLEHE